MIEQGKETHLGKRAFVILCLEKSKIPGIFLVVTVAISLFRNIFPVSFQPQISTAVYFLTLITLGLFIIVFIVGWFDYSAYSFTLEEFDIRMKRGLIQKKEKSIPYRQIQNINIERNPTFQLLGLSRVILETAGHEETGQEGSSQEVIEAIDKNIAGQLRDMLQNKIGIQIVRSDSQ
jgi:membrane protein YdbS with pleckstrin-like domain